MNRLTYCMSVILFCVAAIPALAQSDAVHNLYISAAKVPTNIPGINTYTVPPEGFDPLVATDEELATYGFPPRPHKQADPDHYALWERAMRQPRFGYGLSIA